MRVMKEFRRLLSMLLCVVLIAGMLPASAFAAEEEAQAPTAVVEEAAVQPVSETSPAAQAPAAQAPAADGTAEAPAEEPAAEEPAAEEPASEEPAAEEPASEEPAAEEPAAEEPAAEEPAAEEPAAEEPAAEEPAAEEPAAEEPAAEEPAAEEPAAEEPAAEEPAAEEPAAEESTEESAEEPAEEADPVQELFEILMAFETYEALSDYMDNMTEEQYALLAQFTPEQNAALHDRIAALQENEIQLLDHTFTHLDVRIQNVPLTMTKKVINMVTGATVSTSSTTITASLTKVEYVTINGVTYSNFYQMDAREWRQSNVRINLSALTDSSTAVLVVDLVDSSGNAYDDVRITYNRAGIQYAMEHCDGYRNGEYDGIDFDPAQGANNITLVEWDDYVIPVMKVWEDGNDQDGIRPASVTINLYANGVLNDSVVLSDSNSWQHTFTDKPSHDEAGEQIKYTINEASVPDGYTKTVGDNGAYLTVTNTYVPQVVDISGSKTWIDADDQDGIRPASITIRLLANGVEVASKTVTEADGWAWTFEDLPKFADGVEITYTVSEDAVDGYTTAYDGYNVTNTHTPEVIDISGSKIWNDADNQDGIRPASITIHLLANGVEVASRTITEADGWAWTFEDLPKFADGVEITYTVSEDTVEGYTAEVSGTSVTNTHTPEVIDINGAKIWDDANDQDGIRPASITIHLLANGVEVASRTVTEADGWAWTFEDLPKFADGVEITYTVSEDAVEGYTAEVSGTSVTNTHVPEVIDISGSKTWNDADDQDGKRPASITIRLKADGVEVASKTVTAEDNWAWTFEDLPKFAAGTEITYTIFEDAVEGYTSQVDGTNVTNTHEIEKTKIDGAKSWDDNNDQDGIRPESITIHLLADGQVVATKTVTAEDGWKWSFINLDVYSNGEEIVYTIQEDAVSGYTAAYDGYNVTNTHIPEVIDISGSKTWADAENQDGIRPASITIHLLANGVEVASRTVTEADGWAWTFEDLPKFADGVEITYTVSEDAVEGYTAAYDGYNVTNTHIPEVIDISGSKTWVDAENQDGIRPASITIHLLANGVEVASRTVTEADGWAWTFEDLPKFADGVEITYTVSEDAVEGYTAEVNGTSVTNTHIPEVIDISGSKTWVDADNQDGIRPASITIHLLADGVEVASRTVTEADGWAWTFEDLPKFADGVEITYTISEGAVEGYTAAVSGYDVTNTHEPEKTSVPVAKIWEDNDDQDGLRPNDITVILLADGADTGKTLILSQGNDWADAFTGLDKYAAGVEIAYTVAEVSVDGYTTVITGDAATGFTITNTHTPEKVAVEGTKTWIDDDNQDGVRPASITINLLKNGVVIDTITVTEADGWAWSFVDLPKYEDHGTLITYSITEERVEGYTTAYDGYNVTNTHTPDETSITVTKSWQDNNNQDGIRPERITVVLVADGTATDETLVLSEANNWTGSFTGLAVNRPEGIPIVYTVEEVEVTGYTTVIAGDAATGFTITNTHTPEVISIEGSKTWIDANDQDGKRPASITIRLKADGVEVASLTVTEADGWAWSFADLPKYAAGQEIVYSITEDAVDGYSTTYAGYDVTNEYTPAEISITVVKAWADNKNADGKRPDEVTIILYANGEDTGRRLVLTEEKNWVGSFTGLPKYADGELIEYTIDEVKIKGYNTVIRGSVENGFTVTNSLKDIPATGDERMPMLWIGLMLASMVSFSCAVFPTGRKRRKH